MARFPYDTYSPWLLFRQHFSLANCLALIRILRSSPKTLFLKTDLDTSHSIDTDNATDAASFLLNLGDDTLDTVDPVRQWLYQHSTALDSDISDEARDY